jgi:hypothetical protein
MRCSTQRNSWRLKLQLQQLPSAPPVLENQIDNTLSTSHGRVPAKLSRLLMLTNLQYTSSPSTSVLKSFHRSNGTSIWYVPCTYLTLDADLPIRLEIFSLIDAFTHTILLLLHILDLLSLCLLTPSQYGFSKVRRGPDTDMYAHPSFIRGKPELLYHLRKCPTTARGRASVPKSENIDGAKVSSFTTTPTSKTRASSPNGRKKCKAARTVFTSPPSSSSSTCYDSDHSTSGTIVSHEDHDAGATTPATTRNTVVTTTPKARGASGHSVRVLPSSSANSSNFAPQQQQTPWLLMPKTVAPPPPSSCFTSNTFSRQTTSASSTRRTDFPSPAAAAATVKTTSFKPTAVGGLHMLAMAVDFA